MNQNIKTLLNIIENSRALNQDEKHTISKVVKSVDDELNVLAFKLERTEKVKRTTGILLEETIEELEEKNRTVKIEAALERVRSKTMAMRNSSEIGSIVKAVFDELKKLGFETIRCGIGIIKDEQAKKTNIWSTALREENYTVQVSGDETLEGHPLLGGIFESWKNQKNFSYILEGKDLKEYYNTVAKTNFHLPEYSEDLNSQINKKHYYYLVNFKSGGLYAFRETPFTEEIIQIMKRFTEVFHLAYTRYEDLQRAETQVRKSQIEAALERVRARTMGMQQSEELAETASLLFKQIGDLGIKAWSSGFQIWNTDDISTTAWMSSPDGGFLTPLRLPHTEDHYFKYIYDARKSHEGFFVMESGGKELEETYKYMFGIPEWKKTFGDIEDSGFSIPTFQITHCVFFSLGYLMFITYEPCPEMWDVFKRFGKVFEQTYTRFLDLKQAEAQAREAQIEAALERVRSRSMAMHSSNELVDASDVMFNELKKLEIDTLRIGICTIDGKTGSAEIWSRSEINRRVENKILGVVPSGTHPIFDNMVKAWKEKIPFFSSDREGDEIREYYEKLAPYLSYPERKEYNKRESIAAFFFVQGSLNVISLEPLNEEECQIMIRFAKVFGQMYTRFLDLQNAEAQAREAQIEAALEKVRARGMIMQNSDELADASFVLDSQVRALGIKTWGCAFNIYGEGESSEWFSTEDGILPIYKIPREDIYLRYYDIGQSGESLHIEEFTGKKCSVHYDYLCTLPIVGDSLKKIKASGVSFPTSQIDHVTYFKYGYLLFITLEPVPEAHEIFKRFAKVFEQTYTRFLDLKQAEAQTREAQIETALERVRARTMAMQKSEELPEAANLLFLQVQSLGIPVWSCGYNILASDKKSSTCWMSSEGVIQKPFKLPFTEESSFAPWLDAIQNGNKFFVQELGGKVIKRHYAYLKTLPVVGETIKQLIKSGISLPTYQVNHLSFFTHGFLMFITYEPVPDIHNIFKRFTKVFEQTYTRFLDLENAEKQNKIIQAENKRKSQELEEARQLQLAMLPKELPNIPNLDISVYMKTATEVGGDYYDFHVGIDGTLTIVVGDATGHGMKAGTIVTITKSLFNSSASDENILNIFSKISKVIKGMKFRQLAMCLLILKIKNNKLKISSAAMPPALIYRKKNKSVEEIFIKGMPLGTIKTFPYRIEESFLENGDTILLYSDGLPELVNEKEEMYGYDRIKKELSSVGEKNPEEIINYLGNSALQWADGKALDDDVTFVVIKKPCN